MIGANANSLKEECCVKEQAATQTSVADYFDRRAAGWETVEEHTSSVVQPAVAVLAGVHAGGSVLDVGCGIGVMEQVLHNLGAGRIVAVDVSSKMIAKARTRFAGYDEMTFEVADVTDMTCDEPFESVIIYNAYPHLLRRDELVRNVHKLLVPGGRFVVAHNDNWQHLNQHHEAVAAGVSLGLRPARVEAEAWQELFEVDAIVDTPAFYAFAGWAR